MLRAGGRLAVRVYAHVSISLVEGGRLVGPAAGSTERFPISFQRDEGGRARGRPDHDEDRALLERVATLSLGPREVGYDGVTRYASKTPSMLRSARAGAAAPSRRRPRPCTSSSRAGPRPSRRTRRCSRRARRTSARRPRAAAAGPTSRPRSGRGSSCEAPPSHSTVGEALGVPLQRLHVRAVVAVDRDPLAERDVADDLVAGHRRAALREPDEHVLDALDDDPAALARDRAARLRPLARQRLLLGDLLGLQALEHLVDDLRRAGASPSRARGRSPPPS